MLKLYKFKEFLSEKYFKTDVGTRFMNDPRDDDGIVDHPSPKTKAISMFRDKNEELHDKLYYAYPSSNSNHEKVNKHLTEGYTQDSVSLNNYLHSKYNGIVKTKNKYHEERSAFLSNHLSEIKAPSTFHVYTGLHGDPRKGENGVKTSEEESDHYKAHLPAFTSASIDPKIAGKFSIKQTDDSGIKHQHLLKIEIPKDSTHGRYIDHVSSSPDEREFLIDKGKNIHISKEPQTIKTGNTHIHIWHAKIV